MSSRLLVYGFDYDLTRKYNIGFQHTLDLGGDDQSRSIQLSLERKLPQWRLIIVARLDELDDEQTFGLALVPEGAGSSRVLQPAGSRRDR